MFACMNMKKNFPPRNACVCAKAAKSVSSKLWVFALPNQIQVCFTRVKKYGHATCVPRGRREVKVISDVPSYDMKYGQESLIHVCELSPDVCSYQHEISLPVKETLSRGLVQSDGTLPKHVLAVRNFPCLRDQKREIKSSCLCANYTQILRDAFWIIRWIFKQCWQASKKLLIACVARAWSS